MKLLSTDLLDQMAKLTTITSLATAPSSFIDGRMSCVSSSPVFALHGHVACHDESCKVVLALAVGFNIAYDHFVSGTLSSQW